MKVLSIIGIAWFSLSFVCLVGFLESDMEAAAGWGILGILYAIPYSIVGLVKSINGSRKEISTTQELVLLAGLKDKGALTEDEFQARKIDLLRR